MVHCQSEGTTSSRQNMSLLKEGWLAKPVRIPLKMEFCNLVWQAQAPLLPRSFKGNFSGFHIILSSHPAAVRWPGWLVRNCSLYKLSLCDHCSIRRAAGPRRWAFSVRTKYAIETHCSSSLRNCL